MATSGSYAGPITPTPPTPGISELIEHLLKDLDSTGNTLSTLVDRLEPFMVPEPPALANVADTIQNRPTSKINNSLARAIAMVEAMRDTIDNTRNRIDL